MVIHLRVRGQDNDKRVTAVAFLCRCNRPDRPAKTRAPRPVRVGRNARDAGGSPRPGLCGGPPLPRGGRGGGGGVRHWRARAAEPQMGGPARHRADVALHTAETRPKLAKWPVRSSEIRLLRGPGRTADMCCRPSLRCGLGGWAESCAHGPAAGLARNNRRTNLVDGDGADGTDHEFEMIEVWTF